MLTLIKLQKLPVSITFSPPDKLEIFFQLFLGGLTLKTTPSEKGSKESTNSSSASPPSVIICKTIRMTNSRKNLYGNKDILVLLHENIIKAQYIDLYCTNDR